MGAIDREAKAAQIKAQRGLCYYCESPVELASEDMSRLATWDHKIPRSRGGHGLQRNRVIACHPCNQRKGARTDAEFLAVLDDEYEASFED